MSSRAAVISLSALSLAACAERVPRFDMAALPLPSFQVLGYAAPETDETTAFKLSDQNVVDVKAGFSAAFTDGRTLTFGPMNARRKADGQLVVCGLVSVRDPEGGETGMKLFDGKADFDQFGVLRFRPNRMAGANGKFLDIYTDCRGARVL